MQKTRELWTGECKARYSLLPVPNKAWIASVDLRSIRRVAIAVCVCLSLLFLELSRPSIPYDHLSGALPLTLMEAFNKKSSTLEGCRNPAMQFPLWTVGKVSHGKWARPAWLPQNPPEGFSRWDMSPEERAEKDNPSWYLCDKGDDPGFYDSTADPLKISNVGGEIYEPLQRAFEEHSVEIDHVILLTLESGRKELFPMQQGTPLFDALVDSHSEKRKQKAFDRLVKMTPVAQMLTGEYATDSKGERVDLSHASWQNTAEEGMGGLNVRGALSGSSLTFKSILGSHCGVNPLPVDLLEESLLEIYQPCLPQLFELFNQIKMPETNVEGDVEARSEQSEDLNRPWKSVFMQSITDDYDRQDILNGNMGFRHTVAKKSLKAAPSFSKYKPKGPEINYFG